MTRVIKAEQLNAEAPPRAVLLNLRDFLDEARTVVLDARKEAARILTDARADAQAARRQAAEQGYAEGFARGQNDGYSDGRGKAQDEGRERIAADSAALARLAATIVEELSAARADLMHRARCQMLDFAMELAEKIVGRVAVTDIAAARANLAKALELSCRSGQVVVCVNPAQLDQLREHFAELVEALHLRGVVRLVSDPQISPGGVKLLSQGGAIDATIETQLANVVEALVGAKGNGAAEQTCKPQDQVDSTEESPNGKPGYGLWDEEGQSLGTWTPDVAQAQSSIGGPEPK